MHTTLRLQPFANVLTPLSTHTHTHLRTHRKLRICRKNIYALKKPINTTALFTLVVRAAWPPPQKGSNPFKSSKTSGTLQGRQDS